MSNNGMVIKLFLQRLNITGGWHDRTNVFVSLRAFFKQMDQFSYYVIWPIFMWFSFIPLLLSNIVLLHLPFLLYICDTAFSEILHDHHKHHTSIRLTELSEWRCNVFWLSHSWTLMWISPFSYHFPEIYLGLWKASMGDLT